MSRPLRLGLIGAGRWGRIYIKTIRPLPEVRLTALASRNPESHQWVPDGCTIRADWREILDTRLVDAVIVATPPALHAEMAAAAVRAGLPVLVEKPLTMEPAEALALRDLVGTGAGFVMVDHTHLFNPAYRELKRILADLGAVRSIEGLAGNWGPFREEAPVLWDWASHDVAMCLDLLGTVPLSVEARRTRQAVIDGVGGENLRIRLHFAGPVVCDLQVGNLLPRKTRRLTVHADGGTLLYDDVSEPKLAFYESGGNPADPTGGRVVEVDAEPPMTRVVLEFAEHVRGGSREMSSLELGVDVVSVLRACSDALQAS